MGVWIARLQTYFNTGRAGNVRLVATNAAAKPAVLMCTRCHKLFRKATQFTTKSVVRISPCKPVAGFLVGAECVSQGEMCDWFGSHVFKRTLITMPLESVCICRVRAFSRTVQGLGQIPPRCN